MSPPLRALFYYLWIAPLVLQIVLSAVMVRRKLHARFLMFFLYTIFAFCSSSFLLYVAVLKSLNDHAYYRAFVFESVITTALRFLIIYEIFNQLFKRYETLQKIGARIFRWTAALLLLLGIGLASRTLSGSVHGPLTALTVIDRTVAIMQCGLLVSLFVFSRFFALSWRSVPFGIVLGFGILESTELASSALRTHIVSPYFWDFFGMAIYHLCVLVWLFYVLLPQEEGSSVAVKLPDHDLELWNQELHKVLHQ